MSDMAGSEPDWHRREGVRSSAAGAAEIQLTRGLRRLLLAPGSPHSTNGISRFTRC